MESVNLSILDRIQSTLESIYRVSQSSEESTGVYIATMQFICEVFMNYTIYSWVLSTLNEHYIMEVHMTTQSTVSLYDNSINHEFR